MPCKAKIRRHPDGWQGFLTQSERKIRRQDWRLYERMFRIATVICMVALIFTLPMGRNILNYVILVVSLAAISLIVRVRSFPI